MYPLTIKTDERIFQVHPYFNMGRTVLCNIEQLSDVVHCSNQVNKIEELWNGKFKRISKKSLKDMLEAHRLPTDFLKLF